MEVVMIRINIPGFYDSDTGGPRWGDAQIIDDGKNYDVIDGYCGTGAARLIKRLKTLEVRSPYLHISHAHYDHYNGIERIIEDDYFKPKALYCYNPATLNAGFSKDCAENVSALNRIIKKARARYIDVIFVDNGDRIVHGDIDIMVYRHQPKTAENTDSYINDGSLCYWFPKLKYLTTGDAGFECANRYNLHPVVIKGGHHGNRIDGLNLKPSQMAPWLKERGCLYYWDNDYSARLNDFLMTGRDDAINAGMEILDCHGDINMIFYGGIGVIYKRTEHWSFKCDYRGGVDLKNADLAVVKSVIRGTFGTMDARITNLLDMGYKPANVQTAVNDLYKLIKG